MDFEQIVAKYPGERYQAHLGLLYKNYFLLKLCKKLEDVFSLWFWVL